MVDSVDNTAGITVSTGTDDLAITGGLTGFGPIIGRLVNGTVYGYKVFVADLSEWEQGIGAWNDATNTLARTTIKSSSNGGEKTAFSTGQKTVYIVPDKEYVTAMDNMVDGTEKVAMTTTERSKLAGIAPNATINQTGPELRASLAATTDTNILDDARLNKLVSDVQSFADLSATDPIFMVNTGQSNAIGFYSAATPMVSNSEVYEWQTPAPGNPTTYSWEIADPNRATGYTAYLATNPDPIPIIVGMRGEGFGNTSWALADYVQRKTGRRVYMLSVCLSGASITSWANGAAVEAELTSQLTACIAATLPGGGTLSSLGLSVPQLWLYMQGATDADPTIGGSEMAATDYRDAWVAFKTNMETKHGGVNYSRWLVVEDSAGRYNYWDGWRLVDQATNDYVTVINTDGFPMGDAFHFTGDGNNQIGVMLGRKELYGGSGKSAKPGIVHNFRAAVAPTVNDDITQGYYPGSLWFDIVGRKIYGCLDSTNGAADWDDLTATNSFSGNAVDLGWVGGASSNVATGGTAYDLDTDGAYTSGNLLRLKNNGAASVTFDYEGNLVCSWVASEFTPNTIWFLRDVFVNGAMGSLGDCNIGGDINHANAAGSIGFYGVTAVTQPDTTGTATGFTAGGTAVGHTSTFTGNTGTAAYTIGDIVKALKDIGILAAS